MLYGPLDFQGIKLEAKLILLHRIENGEAREVTFQSAQLALDTFPALLEKEGWVAPQGPGQPRPRQARGQPGESQSPRSLAVLRPSMQVGQDAAATGSHHPPPTTSWW